MKAFKKALSLLTVSALIFCTPVPITAADTEKWEIGYCWNESVTVQTDSYNKTAGQYSIKINNTDFNDTCVQKTFKVKKNTQYRFSAAVKYSEFVANPQETFSSSGASIGISTSYDHSEYYCGNEWKRLEYTFNSGENEQIELCLRNGAYGLTCKGSAWFSDICLEEVHSTMSNEWSVLAVVLKNIDADLERDGEKLHCKDNLDDIDVEYMTGILENLYTSFDDISGGLMRVTEIDVVSSDKVITKLNSDGSIDAYNPEVSEILDEYLAKGYYHQIIVISPVTDVSSGWAGLGGGKYKDIYFCQTNYKSRSNSPGWYKPFPEAGFVHEMLHCMEFESARRNPEITAGLHDNLKYGFTDIGDEWRAWYTAYMRCELPGGKGLDPSVYMVPRDIKYSLISNDMTVSSDIKKLFTVNDSYIVLQAAFNIIELSDEDFYAADIDGDGHITTNDAYLIIKSSFDV